MSGHGYTACVKRGFSFMDGGIERVYCRGQMLEGELEQIGGNLMFVCNGYSFGLDRFDKLTVVVKNPGMTVEELADMMNLSSGVRKFFGNF